MEGKQKLLRERLDKGRGLASSKKARPYKRARGTKQERDVPELDDAQD